MDAIRDAFGTAARYARFMAESPSDDLHNWLRSPLGQRVYALERKLASEALAQVFGWQLLQIGVWGEDDALIAEARTQRRAVLAWHGFIARTVDLHRVLLR